MASILGRSEERPSIRATGIPPHVAILVASLKLISEVEKLVPAMETMRDETVARITTMLEQRAVGLNVVTPVRRLHWVVC